MGGVEHTAERGRRDVKEDWDADHVSRRRGGTHSDRRSGRGEQQPVNGGGGGGVLITMKR